MEKRKLSFHFGFYSVRLELPGKPWPPLQGELLVRMQLTLKKTEPRMDPPRNHWSFCLLCCLQLDFLTLYFWVTWTHKFPFHWSQFELCLQKKICFPDWWGLGHWRRSVSTGWMRWLNGAGATWGRSRDCEWQSVTLPPVAPKSLLPSYLSLRSALCWQSLLQGQLLRHQHRLSFLFVSLFLYFIGTFFFFLVLGDLIIIWGQLLK